MNPKPLKMNGKYMVRHNTREVKCVIDRIEFVLNINTLEPISGRDTLKMNDIAKVHLRTTKPVFFDPYTRNRQNGSLILIDEATNETVAAGMIL